MRKLLVVLLFLILFSHCVLLAGCSGGEIDKIAIVEWVVDGDTFDTNDNERIRLADIDTPEEEDDIDAYWEATNYMISTVKYKTVFLDIDDKYTYDEKDGEKGKGDRLVCVVYVNYNETHYLNVNKALLENDLAVIREFDNDFSPYTWTLFISKNDIPEFASWIILPLFSAATLSVIIFRKRIFHQRL